MPQVTLHPVGASPDDLRFFIRADGVHAGGITVHSISGVCFSYGIALAPAMRRRGIARRALPLLFARMKDRGFTGVRVQVACENTPSLALHHALGMRRLPDDGSNIVRFEMLL